MAQPFKVLVVDDEPDIVQYVEHVLRRLGYEAIGAGNGEEAIQKALNDPPDLIILDVMMPIMDGFAVCRTLREREATRLVPVIIMTALQGVENRVKLLRARRRRRAHQAGGRARADRAGAGRAGPQARGGSAPGRDHARPRPLRQVRARRGQAPGRGQSRRARAGQAGARRHRALRGHQRLQPPGRARLPRGSQRARGAVLRQLPRPDHRRGRRHQRDVGRRLHGHLPGRRPHRPLRRGR